VFEALRVVRVIALVKCVNENKSTTKLMEVYMQKLDFNVINSWMHRNARELDLTIWKCLFLNGSAEKVADALLPYQNLDGGFGKGLDPDNWNINSVPYACVYAIDTLDMVKFYDMNHPVYKGIKKYLEQTGIEKWIFTLPSNKDYPHASFFNYGKEYNKVESLGIVISFSAFILEYMEDSVIYHSIIEGLHSIINKLYENDLGDMGASSYITLIDTMKRLNISGYDYDELDNRLNIIVNKQMQKDEKMWESYGYRPSDFIRSKESRFLNGNEEFVEKECEFLLRTLPENDVWPVSWCWFENAKQYPKEEILSLHLSKARKCIEKVRFLKEFDLVEYV